MDSIFTEGNSFLNNAKTKVESIPELNDIPIDLEFESNSEEIVLRIESSIIFSRLVICFILKSSDLIFLDLVSRLVE
tara:strand:- start:776 stop:1006 length:231 start_codon:yes stop_codon:yes gene_type:complete